MTDIYDHQLVQEEDIEFLANKINKSRFETRQLYQQIDKVKQKIQDSSLVDCSKQVPTIPKNSLNLKPLQVLKGHNNKVADLRWSSDSKSILSCSQDGFLILWDPSSGLKLNAIPLDSQWVLACAYSPNMKMIASAGLTNACTIYALPSNPEDAFQQKITGVFKGHVCGITCVEFVDNDRLLTGSGDMTCALWDVAKSKRIGQYLDHFGDVLSIDINRSKNMFASGASDGYARVWDIRSSYENNVKQSFFVSNSDITSVKFFNDGNSFVTGSDDGVIRMFDLRTDCELSKYSINSAMDNYKTTVNLQTFLDPNPTLAASPVYGQQAYPLTQQYSLTDMNSVLDASGVTSIDFSSSGRLMYSCYSEQGCFIWDLLKGEIVGKLEGHTNRVAKVACSPNGLGVVTASWDATMRVYTPSYV